MSDAPSAPAASARTARWHATLQAAWQRQGPLACALLPLAGLMRGALGLRRLSYRLGLKQATRLPCPVVVIGNLYVGGTGKTPTLISLAQALQARGWHPGVVSRGYGAQVGPRPRVGRGKLDPALAGDEPTLIAKRTGLPIAVHPQRAAAAAALLDFAPEVDVILADDGLQHLGLARDVEILVEDERGVGNGWLLPAGPLREPLARRASVDWIVGNVGTGDTPLLPAPPGVHSTTLHLYPEPAWHLLDGSQCPLPALRAAPRVAAAAGIGQPERFFNTLRQAGLTLHQTLALPDHHSFTDNPFAGLDAEVILITEKDAVKCQSLNDPRLWAVPVTAAFADAALPDWLDARLRELRPKP